MSERPGETAREVPELMVGSHRHNWWRIFFVECLQNVGVVIGLQLGVRASATGQWPMAIALLLGGAFASAWMIRTTESLKIGDPGAGREPERLTFANAVMFALGALGTAAYLLATPATWWPVDLALGVGIGVGVALVQGMAAAGSAAFSSRRSVMLHGLGFALAFPVTLMVIRLGAGLDFWAAVALVFPATVVMSGLIVSMDYQPLRP